MIPLPRAPSPHELLQLQRFIRVHINYIVLLFTTAYESREVVIVGQGDRRREEEAFPPSRRRFQFNYKYN